MKARTLSGHSMEFRFSLGLLPPRSFLSVGRVHCITSPTSVSSGERIDTERPDFSDRSTRLVTGESSSSSASDLIRSVPVAFRNRRKILFDFLACSLNLRSVRQCHFHAIFLSRLAVCYLYCSFGQSQVILRQVEPRLVDGVVL